MFAIYSNFSGCSLFENLFLFLYNTIYTSVPVVIYGLSEQTFPEDVLLKNPELYRINRANHEMKWYRLLIWLLSGLWHSGKNMFSKKNLSGPFSWEILRAIEEQKKLLKLQTFRFKRPVKEHQRPYLHSSMIFFPGCVFFVWLFAWPSIDIYGNGLNTLGGVVAGSAVAVTNLKICLEARYW